MILKKEISLFQLEAFAKFMFYDDSRQQGWDFIPWQDLEPEYRKKYRLNAAKLLHESVGQIDVLEQGELILQ